MDIDEHAPCCRMYEKGLPVKRITLLLAATMLLLTSCASAPADSPTPTPGEVSESPSDSSAPAPSSTDTNDSDWGDVTCEKVGEVAAQAFGELPPLDTNEVGNRATGTTCIWRDGAGTVPTISVGYIDQGRDEFAEAGVDFCSEDVLPAGTSLDTQEFSNYDGCLQIGGSSDAHLLARVLTNQSDVKVELSSGANGTALPEQWNQAAAIALIHQILDRVE